LVYLVTFDETSCGLAYHKKVGSRLNLSPSIRLHSKPLILCPAGDDICSMNAKMSKCSRKSITVGSWTFNGLRIQRLYMTTAQTTCIIVYTLSKVIGYPATLRSIAWPIIYRTWKQTRPFARVSALLLSWILLRLVCKKRPWCARKSIPLVVNVTLCNVLWRFATSAAKPPITA
jgi:hypothetical protein